MKIRIKEAHEEPTLEVSLYEGPGGSVYLDILKGAAGESLLSLDEDGIHPVSYTHLRAHET